MKYLLIRHCESKKNSLGYLEFDNDNLTDNGLKKANILANNINYFIKQNKILVNKLYCSPTIRSKETCKIIASKCKLTPVIINNLNSIRYSSEYNLTENEFKIKEKNFFNQLSLYRNGLFNAYFFQKLDNVDSQKEYESRVIKSLKNEIVEDNKNDIIIIVANHSSLTAIIIYFARIFNNYSNDYYGKIDIDLGNIYYIDEKGFQIVNGESDELLQLP